jgi:hypothetical protein
MKSGVFGRKLIVWACALVLLAAPSILLSDILYLKDGARIPGRVISFEGDTLFYAPSYGGRISVHRDAVAKIIYGESDDTGTMPATKTQPTGPGVVSVTFKDDKLSSKIKETKKTKKISAELKKANWIEQLLIVDKDTVYSRVDTTMDKTIYKGHDKLYKNTIRLDDMTATIESGVYQCVVVIRNLGAETHRDAFDQGPLDLRLEFQTVGVHADQTTGFRVGIKKGMLRMGKPNLYQVQ